MFSCPPRQEAHGQAARNNPNGYMLVCPSSHVTVNSLLLLLAVTPVGFSDMFSPSFGVQQLAVGQAGASSCTPE